MKKRVWVVGGIVVAVGVLGAAGWYFWKNGGSAASADENVYVSEISQLSGDSAGVANRYAGVVEPQDTIEVKIDSGRVVKAVKVKTGDEVKAGQLLFEYDLSSIQQDLQEAQLALDRLKNEALSLTEQIGTLENEKREAKADNQLSYTIEIETNRMNLQKNQYDQKSKTAEIERLQNATTNTEVRSEIDGVIQKIDASKLTSDDGETLNDDITDDGMNVAGGDSSDGSGAFITILSTGAYRIKGTVNEQNKNSIIPGSPVIIRSRVNDTEIWRGIMGNVDQESTDSGSSDSMNYFGMMDSSGDSQTSSSTYPFYVELDSSEGLMLGQHVYIEMDEGQEEEKQGVWLNDYFIVDADAEEPYVWAAGDNDRLEKRTVILGQYDDVLGEYEIADGLTEDDCIAFPTDMLKEGMAVTVGTGQQMMEPMTGTGTGDPAEGGMDDMTGTEGMEGLDMEPVDMEAMDDMEGLEDDLIPMEGEPAEEDISEGEALE